MDECDECQTSEEDGADINMYQVTPEGDPDGTYDAALCDGCAQGYEEQGNTLN